MDHDGRIQRANRAMAALCGMPAEALQGLPLDTLLPPEQRQRHSTHLRSGDVLARLGGDEFAVLLRDLPDEQAALAVADKLLQGLGQPWRLQHHEMFPGSSIGIVFLPRDGRD